MIRSLTQIPKETTYATQIPVRRWGNGQAIRLSKEILEQMVLEKAEKPKYLSFREMVEAFYGKPFEKVCLEREQLGEKVEEIDTGAPVGDEYW